MDEPLAYLNGQFVPASAAVVPVQDCGFVQGVTVAEQLRTFGGKLFRLPQHLARLRHSLDIVEVDPGLTLTELGDVAEQLAAYNHSRLDPGDDLALAMFVTPGVYPPMAPSGASPSGASPPGTSRPTVGMHTYPLPFALWADKYRRGQSLVVTDVVQIPPLSWPRELKCRSRMHYYLADRRAQAAEPGSRALLLDGDGFVCEASTANVVAYFADAGLVSPRHDKILPGISIAVLMELAARLGIPFSERDLTPHDLAAADEVILTGTSPCLLPAVRLSGRPIAAGTPGDCYRRLLAAWNELVGIDIVTQATTFAARQTDRPTAVPRILAHGEGAAGAVFGEAIRP